MAKDPRIRAIEQEADRRSRLDGKTSKKERFRIRNELRAEAGLPKEKKKRGGVAGVWDRNKNVITPVAAGLAALATGGLAAPALVGATMRGLDRPGEGGIGFDIGDAARGAAEGGISGLGAGAIHGGIQGALGASGVGLSPLSGALQGAQLGATQIAPTALRSLLPGGGLGPTPGIAGGTPGAVAPTGIGGLLGNPRNLLGVAQGVNAAYNQMQARKGQREATRGVEREWAANAPMRVAGRESLAAGPMGNPFAPRRVP